MMKGLFRQKGAQLDISILASDEAQNFIQEHAAVLDSTFQKVKMSDKMRERLTRSDYIFSGIKTFHELNEAFPSLLDENGDRKPFEKFLNDVRKIDETYNANYLHAEYNFVHQSAQMAAKWEQFAEDGDRYYLQYRTAHDDKVRPEHAALEGVTLPMSDPFWETYYPPNGWNCRCTVAQVRKQKYPATPHQEAMDRGAEALDGERYNIFRFNSGKQGKAMPDYNPYTIRRCNDCDVAKGESTKLAFTPDNEVCAACKLLRECEQNREMSYKFGKGEVRISHLVNSYDSDYEKLIQIAEHFAIGGATATLTPKMTRPSKFMYECIYKSLVGTKFEGKCPDLNADGVWYEHEGFVSSNPKNAFRNMLNDGLKQTNRLVIDKPDLTEAYMKRVIFQRVKDGQDIEEVWIKTGRRLQLLYKKSEE